MSPAWVTITGAIATVIAAIGGTLAGRRRPTRASSPEGAAILVGASVDLIEAHTKIRSELHAEIARLSAELGLLRERVEQLEAEQVRYVERFGPLPPE